MQHVEPSAFRRGEYTALAGTAETLARYRVTKHPCGWQANGVTGTGVIVCETRRTLADLDAFFREISRSAVPVGWAVVDTSTDQ